MNLSNISSSSKGAALLEFALVLPLLLLLFIGVFYYGQAIRISEASQFASREAGNLASRLCREEINSHDISTPLYGASPVQLCADAVKGQIEAVVSAVHPGVKVILRFYKFDSGVVNLIAQTETSCPKLLGNGGQFDCAALGSRFNAARMQEEFIDEIGTVGSLITAEVFIEIDTPFNDKIPFLGLPLNVIYSAGIY